MARDRFRSSSAKLGMRKIRIEEKIDLPKILYCSFVQCFTNSKNLGKKIGKRSNKRKSKRTKIRDDGRQLRWTLRETTCRGRWFIQTIILAHFTDTTGGWTRSWCPGEGMRARALDMTLDKFTRTVCTRSLQRPSTSLRNDSTSRRCATLSL